VDVDIAGLADGDQLADLCVPMDLSNQPAAPGCLSGLVDQPGKRASEGRIGLAQDGQRLSERADPGGVLGLGAGLSSASRRSG